MKYLRDEYKAKNRFYSFLKGKVIKNVIKFQNSKLLFPHQKKGILYLETVLKKQTLYPEV